MVDEAKPMPKTQDDIMNTSLQNPLEGVLVLEQDETVKFYSKAILTSEDATEPNVGQFILTNRRYLFRSGDNNRELALSAITDVATDYDYVIGAISLGLSEITQGWMHVVKISTIDKEDLIGLIPNDETTTQDLAKALELLTGREKESVPKPEIQETEPARFVLACTPHRPWSISITWQQGEYPVTASKARELTEGRRGVSKLDEGRNGYLVLTNQRVVFAAKTDSLSNKETVTYSVNLEDITSVSHDKFSFNDRLIVSDKSNTQKGFIEPDIQSMTEPIKAALARRKAEVDGHAEPSGSQPTPGPEP